jgi:alpha-methylacyl-CoA racemase
MLDPIEAVQLNAGGQSASSGLLTGIRVIEIAGIGPAPFCCMMLADHGAEVIRVGRTGGNAGDAVMDERKDVLLRSRRHIAVDLKSADGISLIRDLISTANVLVEGFRPGVMERLGLGPDILMDANPQLIYGRMTGWGQTGVYSQSAGHDINYIALAGVLHSIGRSGEKPAVPLNWIGDYGGGGMLLAFGLIAALFHANRTGVGQVVDCAMTDGAALLMSQIWGLRAQGMWQDERGANVIDGAAHFYDTYMTSDGGYISIGALEPKFYALLRERTGFQHEALFDRQFDRTGWGLLKKKLAEHFATRSRDEWCELLEGTDICFAPVLSMVEARSHPHNVQRGIFIDVDGVVQPAPAPRYSKNGTVSPTMPSKQRDTTAVLEELKYTKERIAELYDISAIE